MAVNAGPSERNQAIASQCRNWLRLANLEGLEGSDIGRVVDQIDWQSEIDSSLSASANYERIKEKYGLRTMGETREYHMGKRDQTEQHAREEVRSQIEEYGPEAVRRAVRFGWGPDELVTRVEDILEHYEPGFYDPYIEEGHIIETETEPLETETAEAEEQPEETGSETGPKSETRELSDFLEGCISESPDGSVTVTETTLRAFEETTNTQQTVKSKLQDFFRYMTEPVHDGNGGPIDGESEGSGDGW